MLTWFLRAIFIVMIASLLLFGFTQGGPFDFQESEDFELNRAFAVGGCLFVIVAGLAVDLLVRRKSLAALAGVFFGLAIGLLVGTVFNHLLDLMYEGYSIRDKTSAMFIARDGIKWVINVLCCYLAITFIMQTKDDFRFIIPYVEFSKQSKGICPLVLDTSAIIDGRIVDVATTGILMGAPLVIADFVLTELQTIADSADRLRRIRGRRGLDMLHRMQNDDDIDLQIKEIVLSETERREGVDQRLVLVAKRSNGKLVTTDYNLNKVAKLGGVDVINVNDLANAVKPVVLPGETMRIRVVKAGDQEDQGVGYMPDGTMIVVEQGRSYVGREVEIVVTSALQTSAGRMIFGKLQDGAMGGNDGSRGQNAKTGGRGGRR